MTESDKLLFVHAIEEWERTGAIRWYELYPIAVKMAIIEEGYLEHDRHDVFAKKARRGVEGATS